MEEHLGRRKNTCKDSEHVRPHSIFLPTDLGFIYEEGTAGFLTADDTVDICFSEWGFTVHCRV